MWNIGAPLWIFFSKNQNRYSSVKIHVFTCFVLTTCFPWGWRGGFLCPQKNFRGKRGEIQDDKFQKKRKIVAQILNLCKKPKASLIIYLCFKICILLPGTINTGTKMVILLYINLKHILLPGHLSTGTKVKNTIFSSHCWHAYLIYILL